MKLLTQSRFPKLWNFFQFWFGGTVDKQKLCLKHYNNELNILEIGCSTGNIARAFANIDKELFYTGLDIDVNVLKIAQRKLIPNSKFLLGDIRSGVLENNQYDYILYAGILHHLNCTDALAILNQGHKYLSDKGKIVIVEPLLPQCNDSYFIKLFLKLFENGIHVRAFDDLIQMLFQVKKVKLISKEQYIISASPFGMPKCARFGVFLLSNDIVY